MCIRDRFSSSLLTKFFFSSYIVKGAINIDNSLIEIDNEAVSFLVKKFPTLKNKIIYGNFIKMELKSFFGKFLSISLCWTFSFHILNEIRHLCWDAGFGFDLKIAKVTGVLVFVGSFVLTVLFHLLGRNFL